MDESISVNLSGSVFSFLMYENLRHSDANQEGFILGETSVINERIITDDREITKIQRKINVHSVIPCPILGYFYFSDGSINSEKIEELLGDSKSKVVAWYRFSRTNSFRLTLREKILVKKLSKYFNPEHPEHFLTCLLNTKPKSGSGSTHVLSQTFVRYYKKKLQPVLLNIVKLKNKCDDYTKYESFPPYIENVIESIKDPFKMSGYALISAAENAMQEQIAKLVQELSDSELKLFSLEKEVREKRTSMAMLKNMPNKTSNQYLEEEQLSQYENEVVAHSSLVANSRPPDDIPHSSSNQLNSSAESDHELSQDLLIIQTARATDNIEEILDKLAAKRAKNKPVNYEIDEAILNWDSDMDGLLYDYELATKEEELLSDAADDKSPIKLAETKNIPKQEAIINKHQDENKTTLKNETGPNQGKPTESELLKVEKRVEEIKSNNINLDDKSSNKAMDEISSIFDMSSDELSGKELDEKTPGTLGDVQNTEIKKKDNKESAPKISTKEMVEKTPDTLNDIQNTEMKKKDNKESVPKITTKEMDEKTLGTPNDVQNTEMKKKDNKESVPKITTKEMDEKTLGTPNDVQNTEMKKKDNKESVPKITTKEMDEKTLGTPNDVQNTEMKKKDNKKSLPTITTKEAKVQVQEQKDDNSVMKRILSEEELLADGEEGYDGEIPNEDALLFGADDMLDETTNLPNTTDPAPKNIELKRKNATQEQISNKKLSNHKSQTKIVEKSTNNPVDSKEEKNQAQSKNEDNPMNVVEEKMENNKEPKDKQNHDKKSKDQEVKDKIEPKPKEKRQLNGKPESKKKPETLNERVDKPEGNETVPNDNFKKIMKDTLESKDNQETGKKMSPNKNIIPNGEENASLSNEKLL